MSTTAEQLAAVIASNTALKEFFEGERSRWDEVRQQALSGGIFNNYVDAVAGNDATGTGTLSAPFQSIQAAIDAADPLGQVNIRLLTDYQVADIISCPIGGRMNLISNKAGSKAQITFAAEAQNSPGDAPHFDFPIQGNVSMTFSSCDIRLREFLSGHDRKQVVSRRAQTNVFFLTCDVTALANCNQSFLGDGGGFGISFSGGTHTDMAGHWVEGVAAATDPVSLRECAFSTLATL